MTFDCIGCYVVQQASQQGDYRKWWPPYQGHHAKVEDTSEVTLHYKHGFHTTFLLNFMSTEQRSYLFSGS